MKLIPLALILLSAVANAKSAFIETDVAAIRENSVKAAEAARARGEAQILHSNQRLLNLIPIFAREHQHLSDEPRCNGRPYPLVQGNEPWTDWLPLSAISPGTVWQIMNCEVKLHDGYQCTLNYGSRYNNDGTPTFHCRRGENEHRDFAYGRVVTRSNR